MRIEWHDDRVLAALEASSFEGLELAAEHLAQVSSALAPHEEGHLERSGTASSDRATNRAAVSFDTVYAARQHEELTWRHDPGRQAKYLETPMHDPVEHDVMLALIATAAGQPLR